ncbi:hypothetical protein ACLVWU_08555 [Bdellovibrio sp. HCB290]|uniref:hypothetical protein n=1 Tax=Bdellovibrio sp. HCB290 TaxID=3394356 RepID=UPI0039B68ABD
MKLRYLVYNVIATLLILGMLSGVALAAIEHETGYLAISMIFGLLNFVFKMIPSCPNCHRGVFKAKKDARFGRSLIFVPPKCTGCGFRFDRKYEKPKGE